MEKFCKHFLFSLPTLLFCSSILISPTALAQNDAPVVQYGTYNLYSSLSGWTIGAGLEYKQFSNNGTIFAESSTNKLYNINPEYHAGFDIRLGYRLPGTSTEFNLDYTNLHTRDSRSVWAPALDLFPGFLNLGPANWASSKLTFDYDSLDFTAGQWVGVSSMVNLNVYGGLNYTHLRKRMDTQATGFGNDFVVQGGTTFDGVGPTFGIDGYVSPFISSPNFSFYGGMETSFLYGRMSGFTHVHINGVQFSEDIPDDKIVVPALGGKLGFDLKLPYSGVMWDLQAEYGVKQFFGITKDSNYNTVINSSFQGPSVRLRMSF